MERKFRLAGLLRLRKLQEEQAAARLAVANIALRSTEAVRAGSQLAFATHTMPDGDRLAWGAAVAARTSLGSLLGEATEAEEAARDRVVTGTRDWSATRSRSVGLEKLEEKHRVLVDQEDGRLEQIVLDEIAARGSRGGLRLVSDEETEVTGA